MDTSSVPRPQLVCSQSRQPRSRLKLAPHVTGNDSESARVREGPLTIRGPSLQGQERIRLSSGGLVDTSSIPRPQLVRAQPGLAQSVEAGTTRDWE